MEDGRWKMEDTLRRLNIEELGVRVLIPLSGLLRKGTWRE